jgi:hypothetical protein
MPEVMTPLRLSLLRWVAKHPDRTRDQILALKGVHPDDLAFLEQHDLVRERAPGGYRISRLGEMALQRSL